MPAIDQTIAGLRTEVVEAAPHTDTAVILLHGHTMRPSDLAPFAQSLALPATFYFPQGPVASASTGYSWWRVDEEAKARALLQGPRDLTHTYPSGRSEARSAVRELVETINVAGRFRRILLGGFSQGGMLACDTFLLEPLAVDGLMMLSASRIAIDEWNPARSRLRGIRALVSHGREDANLGFRAGLELHHWLLASGAASTWIEFGGGHQVPLTVWRALRRFVTETIRGNGIGITTSAQAGLQN